MAAGCGGRARQGGQEEGFRRSAGGASRLCNRPLCDSGCSSPSQRPHCVQCPGLCGRLHKGSIRACALQFRLQEAPLAAGQPPSACPPSSPHRQRRGESGWGRGWRDTVLASLCTLTHGGRRCLLLMERVIGALQKSVMLTDTHYGSSTTPGCSLLPQRPDQPACLCSSSLTQPLGLIWVSSFHSVPGCPGILFHVQLSTLSSPLGPTAHRSPPVSATTWATQ